MSVLGIISEYNPYHKGHAHLLSEAKKKTGAAYAVSVMSGCFSQQGLPMILDKYSRAEAAVRSGIDLVFELPVLFATGSARDFAEGAVLLLSRLSLVDHLAFGVENADPEAFAEIRDCIIHEPDPYREILRLGQKEGLSFPAARENALAAVLGEAVRPLVREPNNILALEYMTAIKRLGSPIQPCLIHRSSDYHTGVRASATGIRNHLISLTDGPAETARQNRASYLRDSLPEGSAAVYQPVSEHLLLSPEGMMPYLASKMLELPAESGTDRLPMGMTPEMYHRLRKQPLPTDYETLVENMKRKNETRGRITRGLLHLILGILEEDRVPLHRLRQIPLYLNLLSARSESTHLLRSVSDLTVITRKASYQPADPVSARLWNIDQTAYRFYSQLVFSAHGLSLPEELRRTPSVL